MSLPGAKCLHLNLLSIAELRIERDIFEFEDSSVEPIERPAGAIEREDAMIGEKIPAEIFENTLVRIITMGTDLDVWLLLLADGILHGDEVTRR